MKQYLDQANNNSINGVSAQPAENMESQVANNNSVADAMEDEDYVPFPLNDRFAGAEDGVNWKRNTDLGVDIKSILHSNPLIYINKVYTGTLTKDGFDHYLFIEEAPKKAVKRNKREFCGKYITFTRNDDGSLRPNLKPVKISNGFNILRYSLGLSSEILSAFNELIIK